MPEKDYSCEFSKPLGYLNHIIGHFEKTVNYEKDGSMILEEHDASAFESMLREVLYFVEGLDKDLNKREYLKAA